MCSYVITEERAIEAATATDIDEQAFRAFLTCQGLDLEEEPQPALEDDLRNRGVLVEVGGARNELIANYFLAMGFMQSRGRGWPRMRRLMREHNGTAPRLEENIEGGYVRTTFSITSRGSG